MADRVQRKADTAYVPERALPRERKVKGRKHVGLAEKRRIIGVAVTGPNVTERRVTLCRKRDKSKESVAACAGSRSAIQINFVLLSRKDLNFFLLNS